MDSPKAASPSASVRQLLKDALQQELYQQELRFDARFDRVIAEYHLACAKFEEMKRECEQLRAKVATQQQAISHTQRIVTLKQEAISRLLTVYPHPITPELQYRIEAA